VSQLSHRKATGEFLHNNSNWRTEWFHFIICSNVGVAILKLMYIVG
jgi:hypothetical protein